METKNILVSLFFTIVLVTKSFALSSDTLKLEGKYTGQNIFLQNAVDGPKKCSFHKVFVNGKLLESPNTYGTAFTIDLKSLNLEINSLMKVEILYEKDESIKVLNPESIGK